MTTSDMITWAGVLIIDDGKILTLKETNKNFYQLPGGKMEPGETPEQTVVREVEEELGVPVGGLVKFLEVDEEAKNSDRTMHFILYTGQLGSLPTRESMPVKTESLAWINSDHAMQVADIGNLLKHHVIPELRQKNLIE